MEIEQLRLFTTVASLHSMTQAAQKLHITQSAVSQSMARLEGELGCSLFERSGRGIRLSRAGNMFYERCETVLQIMDDVFSEITQEQQEPSGLLRLRIRVGSALVPTLLHDFSLMYPRIRYQLMQHDTDEEFDLCIDYMPENTAPANGEILLTEEVMLAVPDTHPLALRQRISLGEARDENFIMMRPGSALRAQADFLCRRAGFHPKTVLECDSPATLRALINLGLGTAFLPYISWHSVLDDEHIKAIHIDDSACYRTLGIYAPPNRRPSKATIVFMHFAVSFFSKIVEKIHK